MQAQENFSLHVICHILRECAVVKVVLSCTSTKSIFEI